MNMAAIDAQHKRGIVDYATRGTRIGTTMGMNGEQQRERHTAVTQLAGDVETVMDGFSAQLREASGKFSDAINAERTHRLQLAEQQRSYVDNEDRMIRDRIDALSARQQRFEARGFWQRLNWFLTGR